jgi:hypothetical protein
MTGPKDILAGPALSGSEDSGAGASGELDAPGLHRALSCACHATVPRPARLSTSRCPAGGTAAPSPSAARHI